MPHPQSCCSTSAHVSRPEDFQPGGRRTAPHFLPAVGALFLLEVDQGERKGGLFLTDGSAGTRLSFRYGTGSAPQPHGDRRRPRSSRRRSRWPRDADPRAAPRAHVEQRRRRRLRTRAAAAVTELT